MVFPFDPGILTNSRRIPILGFCLYYQDECIKNIYNNMFSMQPVKGRGTYVIRFLVRYISFRFTSYPFFFGE